MAAVSSMMMMRAPAALNYGAVQRKSTLGGQPISRLLHKCSLEVKCMAKVCSSHYFLFMIYQGVDY